MKRLAVIGIVLLLIAGIAYAKDYEVKKKAGEYNVEVGIDNNPPVVGNNNIAIEVKDASGKHVTDAKVSVTSGMPSMGSMTGHSSTAGTTLKGNKYTGKIFLSMAGPWTITVEISKGNKKPEKLSFKVDAH